MKSNKQRRAELQAKREARRLRAASKKVAVEKARQLALLEAKELDGVAVNGLKLAGYNSYGDPDFVVRGYYLDIPFTCKSCGREEVWSATQQKWWYEVAKGQVYSTARRCRACRRKERERRA
ncbi:MAG TPA: zinc-ribbon domain containing protein [Pirellulales bacterium]|jgi:hypothetical protein|nr:zinc-ribbon domain containing protein [Pirellulales bacterium]